MFEQLLKYIIIIIVVVLVIIIVIYRSSHLQVEQ